MATFQKYLNTYFEFSLNGQWVADLELIEVADTRPPEAKTASPVTKKECFTLIFTGQWPIQQATYTLQHSRLGSFQLLVVPMGSGRYGFEADAIINRLVP